MIQVEQLDLVIFTQVNTELINKLIFFIKMDDNTYVIKLNKNFYYIFGGGPVRRIRGAQGAEEGPPETTNRKLLKIHIGNQM